MALKIKGNRTYASAAGAFATVVVWYATKKGWVPDGLSDEAAVAVTSAFLGLTAAFRKAATPKVIDRQDRVTARP